MPLLGRKIYFTSLEFFFLKIWWLTFINNWKYFMKDKNLFFKKPWTLCAWNRQFSSNGGGIQSRLSKLKIVLYPWNIYTDMRFHKKKSQPLKWLHRFLRTHDCMKFLPPLELNWWFQAPKVRGLFRHKIYDFHKMF